MEVFCRATLSIYSAHHVKSVECTTVIVCAKGCKESSHILSRLASFERDCVNIEPNCLKEYISRNMKVYGDEVDHSAALVDDEK